MKRWHIGHNMTSYSPDSEVWCMTGSRRDAARAVRAEVEQARGDSYGDYRLRVWGREGDYYTQEQQLDDSWAPGIVWEDTGPQMHYWYSVCPTVEECAAEDGYGGGYGGYNIDNATTQG